jgi:hypothetical protein
MMLESVLLGFLFGTLLMARVFPKRQNFYQWIYGVFKRGQTS